MTTVADAIAVEMAGDLARLRAAARLVHREYARLGYIEPCPTGLHLPPLHLLECSATFVATVGGRLAGTGTVVVATDAGLPSSGTFGDALGDIAASGRTAAEATALACVETAGVPASRVSTELIRAGLAWSLDMGVDDWCVVVHPDRVGFWRDRVGMEVVAGPRPCRHVRGHPGVLLRLPIREAGYAGRDGVSR